MVLAHVANSEILLKLQKNKSADLVVKSQYDHHYCSNSYCQRCKEY